MSGDIATYVQDVTNPTPPNLPRARGADQIPAHVPPELVKGLGRNGFGLALRLAFRRGLPPLQAGDHGPQLAVISPCGT